MSRSSDRSHTKARLGRWLGTATAWLLLWGGAQAASTDIATYPLFTSSATAVKPNLLFVLDDSGSMAADDYLPDEVPGGSGYAAYDAYLDNSHYGSRSSQCNGLAFNPATTYTLPVDSTGASLAAATAFPPLQPAALSNIRSFASTSPATVNVISTGNTATLTLATGSTATAVGAAVVLYDASKNNQSPTQSVWMSGTVASWSGSNVVVTVTASNGSGSISRANLRIGDGMPWVYYTYTGSQPAMSNKYTSSGVDTSTTFYKECFSSVGSTPGSAVFTAVPLAPTSSTATVQNYKNWWQYYHTRILMMQSAMSLSFSALDSKYRVGFLKLSDPVLDGTGTFVNVADFDAAQKATFYSRVNSAVPNGYTPTRGALSRAGQYFANKAPGQKVDPIQYSCQKNFTILSTDGYWNVHDEVTGSTAAKNYGPYKLDNVTLVGQQDGGATPRPMHDGESDTLQARTSNLQSQTITPQWTQGASTLQQQSITAQWTQAASPLQSQTITAQWTQGTSKLQSATGTLQKRTSTNSGLTWGGWSNTGSCTWVSSGTNRTQCQYNWGTFGNAAGTCTVNYSTGTSGTWTGNGTNCQYSTPPVAATVTSCTPATASPASPYTVLTAVTCAPTTPAYGTWTNTSSCTTSATLGCRYGTAVNTTVTSCTPVAASPASPYTVPAAVTCTPTTPAYGTWTPVSSCTTSATVGCQYSTAVNTTVATCTPIAPSPGSPYTIGTAVTCTAKASLYGAWTPASSCTTSAATGCQYTAWSSWSTVASCTALAQSTGPSYTVGTATQCQSLIGGAGSSNSLADVAMYYYQTDLRDTSLGNCTGALGSGTDVCNNNVIGAGRDNYQTQHMTLFTIGLGAGGTLTYDPGYLTQTSGDFYMITQGTKQWPVPTATGTGDATDIDDVWHAAVDGRGQYFSATSPNSLANSIDTAINSIKATEGSGSAAATSTLQPIATNNQVFVPTFISVEWTGDLRALTIDPVSGAVSSITTPAWSAQATLDAMVSNKTARKVYYFKKNAGANTGTLRSFTYANLSTDGLNSNFDKFCSMPGLAASNPQQCSTLSPTDLTTANSGASLVDYLLGNEYTNLYRTRTHVLGDIVNGSPVFLGAPPFKYTENNYATFASNYSTRAGVVYVGANDGMLHAFDAATGVEKWAYIPSMVLPNLFKLADMAYPNNHQDYVDGAPNVADIYVGGAWKSILVGGLGAGGRGYYALDITDPNNPVALWEFTDTNLGLTFGNPIVTKRADGTWVVAFASGYNNNVRVGLSTGDGNGHLYLVDANTGAPVKDIPTYTSGTTPAGTVTTPSGLAKLNAWVDSPIDNTAKRFYGGDLLGNLWRFDVDNLVPPNGAALQLAKFQVGGTPQPISTKPELAEITANGAKRDVVIVGTGQYLGTSDLSNTAQQSIYAIQDKLSATGLGDVRAGGTLVTQTLTASGTLNIRTASSNPVDWSVKNGWMIDLPSAGERVNVDMLLQFNTLVVASNIPNNDACTAGGTSWLFQLSLGTGSSISTSPDNAAAVLEGTMTAGLSFVQTQNTSGATTATGVILRNDVKGHIDTTGINQDLTGTATVHRTSWRELAN